MKIAIDISPLSNQHSIRGVGFYLKHLRLALTTYYPDNDYFFFQKESEIPRSVEIIHYPYFDPFFLTLPLTKKTKTIVTVHDMTPLLFPKDFPPGIKGKIKWMIQKKLLKRAEAIITDSNASKKDITGILHIQESNVHTVYLAAGEEFQKIPNLKSQIQNLQEKYNLPEKFALYVGDVTPNKNLPSICKAAIQAHIPLVLVGKAIAEDTYDIKNPWNKDLHEVKTLIRLHPKLLIPLGFVSEEELMTLYNCASVFVMPSLYEGFGLPLVEAMMCGCPVITSKEGSLLEVGGKAAYYVDAYSIDDIKQGIQKVIGDRQLAKKLSQEGLFQAKKFSWKQTAKATIEVYKKVLEK
jgi:glycosyltransferase involved in cell wall biosynthesis